MFLFFKGSTSGDSAQLVVLALERALPRFARCEEGLTAALVHRACISKQSAGAI